MIRNVTIFSKMTFAVLSQATAESQRLYHRTQNTFNRIQNSLLTIEIHDQGKLYICHYRGKFANSNKKFEHRESPAF